MTDLLLVLFTMGIVVYAGYFISMNDADGNTRPDKTLMAMAEDRAPRTKKWGNFLRPRTTPRPRG